MKNVIRMNDFHFTIWKFGFDGYLDWDNRKQFEFSFHLCRCDEV